MASFNSVYGSPISYTEQAPATRPQPPTSPPLDPRLVAQITEQVINSLRATGVVSNPPPPSPKSQHHRQYQPHCSPELAQTEQLDSHSAFPTPSSSWSEPNYQPQAPPPPSQPSPASLESDMRRSLPSNDESVAHRAKRLPDAASLNSSKDTASGAGRPPPLSRGPSIAEDATTLEKIWQALFDREGLPTTRLGQFLRGIAYHIISDFEPRGSLVISPAKMLSFYDSHQLADDIFPWKAIFYNLGNTALSRMYRDLKCAHHFVQSDASSTPSVPALTPIGFQRWMTLMIEAHPDLEHERLSKVVLAMPISNADDIRDRFPKELPRRLLPKAGKAQAQRLCAAALAADPLVPYPRYPRPASSAGHTARLGKHASISSGSSTCSVAVDDVEASPPLIPIERERKPYVAQPGGGKLHEDEVDTAVTPTPNAPTTAPLTATPAGTNGAAGESAHRFRSGSSTSQSSWQSRQSSQGYAGEHTHPLAASSSISSASATTHGRNGSSSRPRRPRSPPLGSGGKRYSMSGSGGASPFNPSDYAVNEVSSAFGGETIINSDEDQYSRLHPDSNHRRRDRSRMSVPEDDARHRRSTAYHDDLYSSRRSNASSAQSSLSPLDTFTYTPAPPPPPPGYPPYPQSPHSSRY